MKILDFLNIENSSSQIIYKKKTMNMEQLRTEVFLHSKKLCEVISGKTIAIYLNNSFNYIIAFFSILKSNKVSVPLNKEVKANEIKSMLYYSGTSLIITDNQNYGHLLTLLDELDINVVVYNMDLSNFLYINSSQETLILEDYSELEDVVVLIHTSGTTSFPKRVMLTNENLLCNIISIVNSSHLSATDKI